MKKNNYLVMFLLIAMTLGLSFCKKSTDTQGLLIGKWKVDSVQLRTVINSQIIYQTIYKPSSDYYDFRADQKRYTYWMTNYDTTSYEIVLLNGSSLIQYRSSADTIRTLTNNSLIFTSPQGSDSRLFLTKY